MRQFPLRVVLTVVYGEKLFGKNQESYELVSILSEVQCTSNNFDELREICCKLSIIPVYSYLVEDAMKEAVKNLEFLLSTQADKSHSETIINAWLSNLLLKSNSGNNYASLGFPTA